MMKILMPKKQYYFFILWKKIKIKWKVLTFMFTSYTNSYIQILLHVKLLTLNRFPSSWRK